MRIYDGELIRDLLDVGLADLEIGGAKEDSKVPKLDPRR